MMDEYFDYLPAYLSGPSRPQFGQITVSGGLDFEIFWVVPHREQVTSNVSPGPWACFFFFHGQSIMHSCPRFQAISDSGIPLSHYYLLKLTVYVICE